VSADEADAGEDAPGPFVGKVRLLLDPGYQKVLHSEIGCEKIESATESLKVWDSVIAAKAGGTAYALRFAAEGDVTRPATLFQEGTLVKAMEREGIGRPSTYAGILDKLFSKGYVCKEKPKAEDVEVSGWEADPGADSFGGAGAAIREVTRNVTLAAGGAADRLAPTGLGERVADYLAGVVPDLLDAGFTARMEADLDKIAEKHGGMSKVTLLEKFYGELQAAIARANTASAEASEASAAASDAGSEAATPTKRRAAKKTSAAGARPLRRALSVLGVARRGAIGGL
jgi:DNA topoisomerase IA